MLWSETSSGARKMIICDSRKVRGTEACYPKMERLVNNILQLEKIRKRTIVGLRERL